MTIRAAADPLAAAGLCGVYDAPLLLVSAEFTPSEVKSVIAEMAADNSGTSISVHIVGGPVSVPDARYNDLAAAVGSDRLTKDRLLATGDRFDMAAEIARDMQRVSGTTPDTVLVANGADMSKFFDALALSPIAAAEAYPILLVSEDAIPRATNAVLGEIKPSAVDRRWRPGDRLRERAKRSGCHTLVGPRPLCDGDHDRIERHRREHAQR